MYCFFFTELLDQHSIEHYGENPTIRQVIEPVRNPTVYHNELEIEEISDDDAEVNQQIVPQRPISRQNSPHLIQVHAEPADPQEGVQAIQDFSASAISARELVPEEQEGNFIHYLYILFHFCFHSKTLFSLCVNCLNERI